MIYQITRPASSSLLSLLYAMFVFALGLRRGLSIYYVKEIHPLNSLVEHAKWHMYVILLLRIIRIYVPSKLFLFAYLSVQLNSYAK